LITYPSDRATLTTTRAAQAVSDDRTARLSIEVVPLILPHKSIYWRILLASAFLVSVPVFVQAPLVRSLPMVSLVGTIGWSWLSLYLAQRERTRIWGELLTGFTWTWLSGSLYWGWLRSEPLWHLPIESIALPLALWGFRKHWCSIGVWFYVGSLFGTTITDTYFYAVDLIPAWRQIMLTPEQADVIFHGALMQMNTPLGWTWAAGLLSLLAMTGFLSFRIYTLPAMAFSGAVVSTILVDGLFWVVARLT
jgi:Protein of unknown function (DUF3120)